MPRDNGQGIFTMDEITLISTIRDLSDAKQHARKVVDESTANDANRAKAFHMIDTSKSLKWLLVNMSNFSLAHQGLKVK